MNWLLAVVLVFSATFATILSLVILAVASLFIREVLVSVFRGVFGKPNSAELPSPS